MTVNPPKLLEFPQYYPQTSDFPCIVLNNFQKIPSHLSKPEKKFTADITYGMLASGREACVLTGSNHPVSIFSKIHSSSEKDYKSVNTITFQAMEQEADLFGRATFAMDRGYNDNKMFLKLDELGQDYVVRLKSNRKLLYHNKWTMATELHNRRKGKVKTNV